MDIPTVSLFGEPQAATARPAASSASRHRRAKILGAMTIATLVGIGSYAATYRALVIISVPAPANGTIAPAPGGGGTTATAPEPATPAQSRP